MFNSVEQFETTWTQEAGFTQNLMDALTDKSLGQSVADGHRTLGGMAWHIVTTIPQLTAMVDLPIDGPEPTAPVPATAKEIQQTYKTVSQNLLESVKANWNDATFEQEDDLWGETWKRGRTLLVMIVHEIHHRGQMTVLMRQAGLKVPDIYGPSKESWEQKGVQPPEV